MLQLHKAAGARGWTPGHKRDLGALCVPARVVSNPLPNAAGFCGGIRAEWGSELFFQSVDSWRHFCARYLQGR